MPEVRLQGCCSLPGSLLPQCTHKPATVTAHPQHHLQHQLASHSAAAAGTMPSMPAVTPAKSGTARTESMTLGPLRSANRQYTDKQHSKPLAHIKHRLSTQRTPEDPCPNSVGRVPRKTAKWVGLTQRPPCNCVFVATHKQNTPAASSPRSESAQPWAWPRRAASPVASASQCHSAGGPPAELQATPPSPGAGEAAACLSAG